MNETSLGDLKMTASGMQKAMQDSPVSMASSQLQTVIDGLHASISHIEDRMGAVLSPEEVEPASNAREVPLQQRSYLVGRIESWTGEIDAAIRRINALNGRIEL